MMSLKALKTLALLGLLIPATVFAADELEMKSAQMEVTVEVPRLNVSEYHRPYVAIWIQNEKQEAVVNLAVWYQQRPNAEGAGEKWLPDLRQWWRRSGRDLEFPIDGVTSATRPAGDHTLTFDQKKLSKLTPGKYRLMVEGVREVGGREIVEIPFSWPSEKESSQEAQGTKEIGKVKLILKP
ncbi:DUF2271 domain-containing protein [Planctomicrobium sp. SH668]|uniref:DUF2271 domain-containing protein n=1 Tax=Planctomicrobium sp. SH668 TaxID=3448126 RepID=UPI003F5B0337